MDLGISKKCLDNKQNNNNLEISIQREYILFAVKKWKNEHNKIKFIHISSVAPPRISNRYLT